MAGSGSSPATDQRVRIACEAWKRNVKYADSFDIERTIKRVSGLPDHTDFSNLHLLFEELKQKSRNVYDYLLSKVIPKIEMLAMSMRPETIQILKAGMNCGVILSRLQVSQILANGFFCTFGQNDNNCGHINFIRLYSSASSGHRDSTKNKREKLKCLLTYFKAQLTATGSELKETIIFKRIFFDPNELDASIFEGPLSKVTLDLHGNMFECHPSMAQVDFANRHIGGGVLGNGCVQEEIKFAICPELIASCLFTEPLGDTEAIIVQGVKTYSRYKGYAASFEFTGEVNPNQRPPDTVIAIDAINFKGANADVQREEKYLHREIAKAYIGFKESPTPIIATGNWGGGAFAGNLKLKMRVQWIAASMAKKNLHYYCFGDQKLFDELKKCIADFQNEKTVVLVKRVYGFKDSWGTALSNFFSSFMPAAFFKSLDKLSQKEIQEALEYEELEKAKEASIKEEKERQKAAWLKLQEEEKKIAELKKAWEREEAQRAAQSAQLTSEPGAHAHTDAVSQEDDLMDFENIEVKEEGAESEPEWLEMKIKPENDDLLESDLAKLRKNVYIHDLANLFGRCGGYWFTTVWGKILETHDKRLVCDVIVPSILRLALLNKNSIKIEIASSKNEKKISFKKLEVASIMANSMLSRFSADSLNLRSSKINGSPLGTHPGVWYLFNYFYQIAVLPEMNKAHVIFTKLYPEEITDPAGQLSTDIPPSSPFQGGDKPHTLVLFSTANSHAELLKWNENDVVEDVIFAHPELLVAKMFAGQDAMMVEGITMFNQGKLDHAANFGLCHNTYKPDCDKSFLLISASERPSHRTRESWQKFVNKELDLATSAFRRVAQDQPLVYSWPNLADDKESKFYSLLHRVAAFRAERYILPNSTKLQAIFESTLTLDEAYKKLLKHNGT